MLLSINKDKVADLMKSAEKGYAVSTSDVPTTANNSAPIYPVTSETFWVVYSSPVVVTPETKEQLMEARHKIEESGVPLKGAEALTREIDEMRGRR